jgi:hypothetical protein
MRFLNYLNEEYIGCQGLGSIFSNPTPKELHEFDAVRFILDDNSKNVFVSDENFFHPIFYEWLRKNGKAKFINKKNCFMGSGVIEGNKIKIDSVSWEERVPEDIRRFGWANKYFSNLDKYIDDIGARQDER